MYFKTSTMKNYKTLIIGVINYTLSKLIIIVLLLNTFTVYTQTGEKYFILAAAQSDLGKFESAIKNYTK